MIRNFPTIEQADVDSQRAFLKQQREKRLRQERIKEAEKDIWGKGMSKKEASELKEARRYGSTQAALEGSGTGAAVSKGSLHDNGRGRGEQNSEEQGPTEDGMASGENGNASQTKKKKKKKLRVPVESGPASVAVTPAASKPASAGNMGKSSSKVMPSEDAQEKSNTDSDTDFKLAWAGSPSSASGASDWASPSVCLSQPCAVSSGLDSHIRLASSHYRSTEHARPASKKRRAAPTH